jgi:hypothetical protein
MQSHLNNFSDWWKRAWLWVKTWRWDLFLEILMIIAWVLWVGRSLVNFDPLYLPFGNEVPMTTQSHFVWETFQKCGLCVLWNGSVNGGAPSFAETQGAVLHPLVILTTILVGVVNGTKLVLLGSLILAGIAQWWLAWVMGLGRASRLWAAAVAVVAGSLLGRMDNGGVLFVLSQASASLLFAPIVGIYLHRKTSHVIWLGILLAMTWLSGQGYIQVGVIMGVLPALLLLVLDVKWRISPIWKDYSKALLISFLLAGVMWVPLLNFFPNFVKDGDPYLTNLQPLASMPLNLVIRDKTFFEVPVLGHDLNLYINYLFIGWIPVILAALSLRFAPRERSRVLWYLWSVILLVFTVCSIEFIGLLHKYLPILDTLRSFSVIAGLVIPPLLGLAAWSMDEILKKPIPVLSLRMSPETTWSLPLKWVLWVFLLAGSLIPLVPQRMPWLDGYRIELPGEVVAKFITPESQWVTPLPGEYLWNPVLLARGAKLTDIFRPWQWKDNPIPPAALAILRSDDPGALPGETARFDNIRVIANPENMYAFIATQNGNTPCSARATGGMIDVTCSVGSDGTLIVRENHWQGWQLWVDGERQDLISDRWLSTPAEAGSHVYQFRYRPWDVLLGLLVTISGLAFIAWLIFRDAKKSPPV